MNPEFLLKKYFPDMISYGIVRAHSILVAKKAVTVAQRLGLPAHETAFVHEASILHDIGVCRTNSPGIGCTGNLPYIMHGVSGREILESEGLPRHALVCERHIGVGLTAADIEKQVLPLPIRDMVPLSTAERIVCFADLFYSKNSRKLQREKTPEDIRQDLVRYGEEKVAVFDLWLEEFGEGFRVG